MNSTHPATLSNDIPLSPVSIGNILSWQRVLMLLQGGGQESLELADALTAAVGNNCPFKAAFWETIPLSRARLHDTPFAFVLADAPLLETMEADSHAFDEHKRTDGALVRAFNNLGGDALLISPVKLRQGDSDAEYIHVKVFMSRNGEMEKLQARQMWKALGDGLKRLLDDPFTGKDQPLWVSASGLGIGWLHLRIDKFPKYYTFHPFKTFPPIEPVAQLCASYWGD